MTGRKRVILTAELWFTVILGTFYLGARFDFAAFTAVMTARAVCIMLIWLLGVGAVLGLILLRRQFLKSAGREILSLANGVGRLLRSGCSLLCRYLRSRQAYSDAAVSRLVQLAGSAREIVSEVVRYYRNERS